jgi:arylsulfatase A-like enzyme
MDQRLGIARPLGNRPAVRIAVVSLLAVAPWFACSLPTEEKRNPVDTVVLVSIDSLRADHLGIYGYGPPASPTIDRLAAEGTVFDRAYSTTSWTLPAHASLFTGLDDYTHGAIDSRKKLAASFETLAEALRREGVRTTGFFTGPYLHPSFGMGQGFDEYVDCTSYGWSGLQPGERIPHERSHRDVTNPLLLEGVDAWLGERQQHARNLIFIHMWDVHADYLAPDSYVTLFDPDYDGSDRGRKFEDPKGTRTTISVEELRRLIAHYDAEIRYTDDTLRDLLDRFRRHGLLDRAAVIVLADHGEEFFDHGRVGHRRTLFEEVLRVPLILHVPGLRAEASRVEDVVSLIDVYPTVCELLDVDCRYSGPGVSLLPYVSGRRPENARGDALAELTTRFFGVDQTALVRAEGKLIRSNTTGDLRYFDLRDVPIESKGVVVDPDRASDGAGPAASALRESEADVDPATREHLRALGYVE